MTGILPIKKYGTHSALNMFDEYSMTNAGEYARFIGFTETEVKVLCEKYQIDFDAMKNWYDGYMFPQVPHIYNPKSVVDSILRKDFASFWTQTETYEALKIYIDMNFDGLKDAIVELTPDQALTVVKDGKAYTGKFEVYDADGFLLYTVPVSYTKTIPTTVPEGFTVKTNQVANGIYNCYLVPTTATAATTGSMAMDQIFNFGKGNPAKYEISFAESAKNAKNELIAIDVVGTGSITVDKDYIDDKTEHATSVSYNYGQITSQKDNQGVYIDQVVSTGVQFNTVFCVYTILIFFTFLFC